MGNLIGSVIAGVLIIVLILICRGLWYIGLDKRLIWMSKRAVEKRIDRNKPTVKKVNIDYVVALAELDKEFPGYRGE